MTQTTSSPVVRQLEAIFEGGSVLGLSDRQLVERYTAGQGNATGQAAFAALVGRHGPMVLRVCREVLGDYQHSEDAFQAVFLVLARKARAIREPDLLGNWLYGVATRTARCARQRIARRKRQEGEVRRELDASRCVTVAVAHPPADKPAIAREEAEALHEEITRLPRAFQKPVVLCYFEGLTLDEAARRLHCPAGTAHSRLARAREKLRVGLSRRGIALRAAALSAALSSRRASASIPSLLCELTTRTATSFAARHAAVGAYYTPVTALAHEVLRTMLLQRLKLTAVPFVLVTALATGAVYQSLCAQSQARVGEPNAGAARTEPRLTDSIRPAPGRMTVNGRVLDPAGQPLAGALVEIVGRRRKALVASDKTLGQVVLLGRGTTDRDGRIRLDTTRSSSLRFHELYALVRNPAFGWAKLNPDAEQPGAEIFLRPEQIIRGRLVDENGQPAPRVEVRAASFGQAANVGRLAEIWAADALELGTWPRPVRTDGQGRFEFRGLGRGLYVTLSVRDPRFAPQGHGIASDDRDGPIEVTLVLQPARTVEGRVVAADTGQPIPDTVVEVAGIKTRTGADGRFRASVSPPDRFNPRDSFGVTVFGREGSDHLVSRAEFVWTKGAVKKEIEIKVPRGVVIRGKVMEAGTGRPLSGASVQYLAINGDRANKGDWDAGTASRDDGFFRIVVPPGRGHLRIFGPTAEYVLEVIGANMLYYGRPGGERHYAHRIVAYEVKAGDQPHEIDVALRPGKSIKGRVIDAHGQAVAHAGLLTRLYIEPFNPSWRGQDDFQPHARDGRFELHGVDPEASAPVYFLDADHEWGATFEATGKLAGELVTVRLLPCGQAKARLVDPNGKPVAGAFPWLEIVVTPGPLESSRDPKDRTELSADAAVLPIVDPKHYRFRQRPLTDGDGRVTMPNLIPGAPYRLLDRSVPQKGEQIRKEFTLKPGETLDLGDVLIEKPSG
jgi:RNA polymerase sigma factor (sigma-70 family)